MSKPRLIVWICAAILGVLGASAVSAQSYPSKSIRVVTSAPGGASDFASRLIGQAMSVAFGQPVIVDNRGGGTLSGDIVAKAAPDGYTLLVSGSSQWLGQFIQDNLPYDAVKDFSPITTATTSPSILTVNASVAANSVKELIALAKARPGELNYASSGAGGSAFLAGELFNAMAHVNIVRIPYKGNAPGLNALLANQVQLMFASPQAGAAHVKAGRLKALAVTSAKPSALLPELPTVAAAGLPGYESGSVQGVFAPAKTPAVIIRQLNQEMVRIINRPDMKEKFLSIGVEPIGSSPEELSALMRSDMNRYGKLIKDSGARGE